MKLVTPNEHRQLCKSQLDALSVKVATLCQCGSHNEGIYYGTGMLISKPLAHNVIE